MSAEQLKALKAYCHIDHDDDDELLGTLWDAAVEYLGGTACYMPDNAVYIRAVHGIVNEWYSGEALNSGVVVGLKQLVTQLKMSASDGGI